MQSRARRKTRRKRESKSALARDLIDPNVYAASKDESYTIISRLVDETLKDPEVRDKIQYHARAIIKLIAERL